MNASHNVRSSPLLTAGPRLRPAALDCRLDAGHGTGSKPPGWKGWQRKIRRTARNEPCNTP